MEVCRACTNRSISLVDIFSQRPLPEFKCSLAEMIAEIVDVAVNREDKLPLKLCLFCSLSVQSAFKFKRMFEKNHQLLSLQVINAENQLLTNEPKTGVQKENKSPRLPSTPKPSETKRESIANPIDAMPLAEAHTKADVAIPKTMENTEMCIDLTEEEMHSIIGKTPSESSLDVDMSEEDFPATELPPNIDNSQYKKNINNESSKSLSQTNEESEMLNNKAQDVLDSSNTQDNSNDALDSRPSDGVTASISTTDQTTDSTKKSRFTCTYCQKGFGFLSAFTTHVRTHTGERPFKCGECAKAFTRIDKLKNHMQLHSIDRGRKPNCVIYKYRCTHCTASFKTNTELLKHIRKHTGERPYKCDQCIAEFTQSAHLTRHKYIHTGERPYKCSLCPKGFIQAIHLTRHLGSHARKSNKLY